MRAASALIFVTALAAPFAGASAEDFPALYSVTKVEKSDRLNLRERPDAKSTVVGALAPDAEDIEVTELSRDGTWGRVNSDDRAAWVAMRFLTRQEGPPWWDASVPLSCYGTEPFWGLKLAEGEARFDSPDGPEPPLSVTARAEPKSSVSGGPAMLGLRFGEGFAIIQSKSCSDGMSDRANGLTIDLFRPTAEGLSGFSGCCALQR